MKRALLTVSLGVCACAGGFAQEAPAYGARLADSAVYSDPGFQDFIETAYGYLNPLNKPEAGADFRDAPASRAGGGAGDDKYVFVRILPRSQNYSALLQELSACAGFVLYGERTVYSKSGRTTQLLGWARAGSLAAISQNPGVAGVYTCRQKPGSLR
ncbi:MAG: hypothetical protein HY796_07805 [Elusimicrobia bacterium]|nr:hypothetical protein [Elusimicrobiota bacterium]